MYKVYYVEFLARELKKRDYSNQKKIIDHIEHHLAKDPKGLGKSLTGEFKGYWRYRFENYRIIYKISAKEVLIITCK